MKREQIDNLWQNPAHWTWGIVYRCAEDPRPIVPRRWRWGGWTLNFAHPRAHFYGFLALATCVGPSLVAHWLLGKHQMVFMLLFTSIFAVILWAHWESSRTR